MANPARAWHEVPKLAEEGPGSATETEAEQRKRAGVMQRETQQDLRGCTVERLVDCS